MNNLVISQCRIHPIGSSQTFIFSTFRHLLFSHFQQQGKKELLTQNERFIRKAISKILPHFRKIKFPANKIQSRDS